MWKKAHVDRKGEYENEDVQEIVNRIVKHITILHSLKFLSFMNLSYIFFFITFLG